MLELPFGLSKWDMGFFFWGGGGGGGKGCGGGECSSSSNVPGPPVMLAQVTDVTSACTAQDEHLALLHRYSEHDCSKHSITKEKHHCMGEDRAMCVKTNT